MTVSCIQLIAPALMAIATTIPLNNRICCETPAMFGAEFRNIEFFTNDGLRLSGWYIPPKNGAVIILVHSYYSDRRQTMPVAEMLYKHGYGVLMYDQRASGESEGNTRSLGALDIPDLGRAANWLSARQKDVRIGAYGCSNGGAITLAGALETPTIRSVAVDAPSPMNWNDGLPPISLRDPFSRPTMALYYAYVTLLSGTTSPASTLDNVRTYTARPILFISTGLELEFSRVSEYFKAAGEPKSHWNIPDSSHCAAPITHPQEYEQHLVGFFNSSLLK
jgi:fermentation-respiration switch protein FrsA (DUF1100 family)